MRSPSETASPSRRGRVVPVRRLQRKKKRRLRPRDGARRFRRRRRVRRRVGGVRRDPFRRAAQVPAATAEGARVRERGRRALLREHEAREVRAVLRRGAVAVRGGPGGRKGRVRLLARARGTGGAASLSDKALGVLYSGRRDELPTGAELPDGPDGALATAARRGDRSRSVRRAWTSPVRALRRRSSATGRRTAPRWTREVLYRLPGGSETPRRHACCRCRRRIPLCSCGTSARATASWGARVPRNPLHVTERVKRAHPARRRVLARPGRHQKAGPHARRVRVRLRRRRSCAPPRRRRGTFAPATRRSATNAATRQSEGATPPTTAKRAPKSPPRTAASPTPTPRTKIPRRSFEIVTLECPLGRDALSARRRKSSSSPRGRLDPARARAPRSCGRASWRFAPMPAAVKGAVEGRSRRGGGARDAGGRGGRGGGQGGGGQP